MDLWHGPISEFIRSAKSRSLSGDMAGQFVRAHRYSPSTAEVHSWDNSLAALADAMGPLRKYDIGLIVTTTNSGAERSAVREPSADVAGMALEYHLPLSGKRVDVVATGRDSSDQGTAVVIELKQWSNVALEDEYATNILVGGEEHVHPCEQARDYTDWLANYHSAFTTGILAAVPAAFCHELSVPNDAPLRDPRFDKLLRSSPLFVRGQDSDISGFLDAQVGAGGGLSLLNDLTGAQFKPSKRVLDTLDAVLESRDEWHLLDEQRLAFNAILDEVRRQQARAGRAAILVRGAPGTGKTVVAIQLLAASLRLGWKAAHSTGGKAFTTALRSKFRGADGLFLWNLNLRDAPSQGLDLLLVDEAHRVRDTSDLRWTPQIERRRRSQTEELLNAAKVTVFLLDENQFVRPDEVGSSDLIRRESKSKSARVKEFDLQAQFRCGGCVEYVAWVDWLLGFSAEQPKSWREQYEFTLAESPDELERSITLDRDAGQSARLVAGFCWRWSAPTKAGELLDDVVIGDWRRPWNRKPGSRQYKPENHPYTRWAETAAGESQVGCIYSAQGFEFDRIGVIWGRDLVWRNDCWVAQPKESHDKPVKSAKNMFALVRNAYRVLLTRGLRGARLLVLDPETRARVRAMLASLS